MVLTLDDLVNRSKHPDYHLGKLVLDVMMAKPPDAIVQIDAATGEQETYSSLLSRSVRLARRLRKAGFRPGDVLLMGGRNTIHQYVPYLAAHLNGLPVAAVDPFYKYDEIKQLFNLTKPKVAFCDRDAYDTYTKAVKELGLDVKIVTFDGGEGDCTLEKYMEENDDIKQPIEEFKAADIDKEKVYAWLVSTSGTSGVLKLAAFHHQTLLDQMLTLKRMEPPFGEGLKLLNVSPVHWISAYFFAISQLIGDGIKLQTSRAGDVDHVIDVINKYKPAFTFSSPALFASILQSSKPCDLTCFFAITLTGSKVYEQTIVDLKARMRPDALIFEAYGSTEMMGPALAPNPLGPQGSCGAPLPWLQIKLVDPETDKEITEPHVTGELWTKGRRFACYYNNPEETAKVLTADGWFKTGDLLYRDENHYYFFVQRLKMLIKYRNYHVNPMELEEVIAAHPDVSDVCVTSIPHPVDGEHPVACVVVKPGGTVSAEEIKKMVADKLTASKQLHGGVLFVSELPKTSTDKVMRPKLKQMVQELLERTATTK